MVGPVTAGTPAHLSILPTKKDIIPISPSVEQAFVKQFERDVHEAYQRTGSKLGMTVRTQELR